jgi:nicotinamidase-related amidase
MNLTNQRLLSPGDSLLVIIDMQERLLPVITGKERVVENVIRLVKFSHIIGLQAIVTEQEKLGNTIPEICKELGNIEPIPKLEFNCFRSSLFSDKIRGMKRSSLIIAGIEAHICVAQTALHGLAHYTIHVVSDATSSRSLHNWEIAIHRMRQAGAIITSTEMVIYELLGKAGTDTFRESLKLVK